MKENLKLGAILLVITSIAGLLLGFANDFTKEAILENSKINKDDLRVIMPEATGIVDSSLETTETISEIYTAVKGEEEIGYVFKVTTKGFHGGVDLVVAVSNEDKVTGIKVLAHSETPGLGARIEEEGFRGAFTGLNTASAVNVVKMAPSKDNEVQGISGASVSSKAVGAGVNDVLKYYTEKIKGETLQESGGADANSGASGDGDWSEEGTGENDTDADSAASSDEW